MARNLIRFQDAKDHLEIDHDLSDRQIDVKRGEASGIIIDYLKITDDAFALLGWVDKLGEPTDLVPGSVSAAVKLVLGGMYENRDGDVWRSPQVLSQSVVDILMRRRDPAFA